MSMLNDKDGPGEFLNALYQEVLTRVAGCFVNDDRTAIEVSVHLRGWRHREWSKNEGQRKVWLYVQVQVDGRLAHELELNRMHSAPIGLRGLLSIYLVDGWDNSNQFSSGDEAKGREQVEWLCRAVDQYLEASARAGQLLGRAA